MKDLLKKLLRLLFGEYAIYRIYTRSTEGAPPARSSKSAGFTVKEVGTAELMASPDELIREQGFYLGSESIAFACYESDRIVGVCFYWFGDRYRTRNFWPLASRQAKLVQIITIPAMRGREVAPTLIADSVHALREKGFERVFARIWHSNTPSLRAFTRAGWNCIGTVIEVNPLRSQRPVRLRLGQ